MKQLYQRATLLLLLVFLCTDAFAQYGAEMIGSDIFMQASHCELGIGYLGAYGTFSTPPSGYHQDVYQFGAYVLGFVADPDEDGWSVGTPNYFGDYFMPGSPVEGWAIQVNGTRNDAYYQNDAFTSSYGSGGLSLSGKNISVTNDGNVMTACWQGTAYSTLSITQITVLDTNQMFWVATITLANTGTTTLSDIYYMRELDPDNEEPETGSFVTSNTIDYTGPDSFLVSAVGTAYPPRSYLGLGTKYPNSKVFICNTGLLPSESEGLDAIYGGTAYDCTYSGSITEDVGIGLVMHLNDLGPGATESFKYTYIVKGGSYDSALIATSEAEWSVGSTIVSGAVLTDTIDTVASCTYGTDTNYVKILNAGGYSSWTWSPSTGLSSTTGTSNTIITDTSMGLITYTITGTPGCGVEKKTFLLTISPGITSPPKVTTISPLTYCIGVTPPPLSVPGINVMWYTTSTGGTGTSIVPTISTAKLGTTTYYLAQSIAGCTSPRDSIKVNIISPPVITASSNSPVCSGNVLSLIASDTISVATVTYNWAGPASFSSTLKNPEDTGVTVSAAGVYTLTGIAGGCISKSVITVDINPTPVLIAANPLNPNPCGATNGSITLTGLTAGDPYLVYYVDSVIGFDSAYVIADTSGAVTIAGLGAGRYSNFSALSTSGCLSNTLTDTLRLTGPPLGAITATNSGPICADTTLLLSASDTLTGSVSYNWSGPNSFSSTIQNPLLFDVSTLASGVYYVYATKEGCVTPVSTTTVLINPTLVISGTSYASPTTCGGTNGSITLSGLSAGTGYAVSYTGTTSAITTSITADSSGNIVIAGLSAGTYTNVSVRAGCPSNVVGPFVLNDHATPVITGISNTGPVCAGSGISLSGTTSPVTGLSYLWSGPGGFSSTLLNDIIPVTTTKDSGLYTLTVSDSGCTSAPMYTNVIIYPIPSIPLAGSNSPLCADSTLFLTATDSLGGVTYNWNGPDSFTSGLANPTLPDVSLAGAGVYSVSATANGCTSGIGTENVVVTPVPVITSVNHTDPTSCLRSDGSISLGGLTGGTVYVVSYNKLAASYSFSLTADSTGSVTIYSLSAGTYDNLSVSAGGCPSNTVGPVILKNPSIPVITSVSNNGPICAGASVNLYSTVATAGVNYLWTGPNKFSSTLDNPLIGTTTPLDSGTYSLTVEDSGCVSVPLSMDVVVYGIPPVPVAGSNSPICSDSTLYLTATDAIPGVSYNWTGPDSFGSLLQNPAITNIPTAGGGIYSVIATLNGCSSPQAIVLVVVNATPVISIIGSTGPTTCFGANGTITLGGLTGSSAYGVNYTTGGKMSTVTLTANASGDVVLSGLKSGSYTNINVVSSSGCLSNTVGPVTLSDPATPVISSMTNSGPVCAGASLSFSSVVDETVSYSWSGPSAFSSTSAIPVIAVTTTANSGIYTLTVEDSGCVSAPVSTEAIVNGIPAIPVAGSNSPVCGGSTLFLTATDVTGGVSYIWSGPLGYSSGIENPSISSVTVDNGGVYSVIATANGCTSAAGTTLVVVNATPVISGTSTSNPTICLGSDGTITLNGPAAGTVYTVYYTFDGFATSTTITADGSGAVILTGLSAGVYSNISVTANGCPSNSVGPVTLVDPGPPAVPELTSNSPVCEGGTLSFTSTEGTADVNYSWTGPGFSTANTSTNPSVSYVGLSASGVYTLTVSQNSCSTSNTISVVIEPAPPVPMAGSNSPVCSGNTIELKANSAPNVVYSWSGPSGYSSTTLNTVVNIPGATVSQSGVYTVTATLDGCPSLGDDTVSVVVVPELKPDFTYNLILGCAKDSIYVTNTSLPLSYPGLSYYINFGDGSSTSTVDTGHAYNTTVGTFNIKLVMSVAQCSDSAYKAVSFDNFIKSGFTYSYDTICSGITVIFNNTSTGTSPGYLWYFGDGVTDTSTNPTHTYNAVGTYTVELVANDQVPCYDTTTAVLSIDSVKYKIGLTQSDSVLCMGASLSFSGVYTGRGNSGIVWNFGDGDSIMNINPAYHSYAQPGQYHVTLEALYNGCPATETTGSVSVIAMPLINLGPDTAMCPGSAPITLADNINASNPAATWLWSTGETTSYINATQPDYYSATVNIGGCTASDTVWIKNDCYVDIPNAFTPNGDGVNDYFFPRQYLSMGLVTFKMNIYNRWGQLIFTTTSTDGRGWDGDFNGVAQAEGVYVYVIDATFIDGQKEHKQGNVTLLR